MGFTIQDALNQTGDLYCLKLIAGEQGCENSISWVHMIEDTTIIQQLWGKELAVTTGLGFQSHDALLKFIQTLIRYHSVGLIINTGKYIFDIPEDIIDLCNEHHFPLLTTPWRIHMADLIKDFSMRCITSQKDDKQISRQFKKLLIDPRSIEGVKEELKEMFDINGYFQVLMIAIENSETIDFIERRRIAMQIELCFDKIACPLSFFWFDGYFVLILNNLDVEELEIIINRMYQRSKKKLKDHVLHIGVGTRMKKLDNVIGSYKRSLASVEMANCFHYPMIFFEEMGIYQILFSIEDKEILNQMYKQFMHPLVHYDQKHHSELEKTLYCYLLYDGNHQEMANQLFVHRNTIIYRMSKIKELIQCDLSSLEEKMPYMMAYYIKSMNR